MDKKNISSIIMVTALLISFASGVVFNRLFLAVDLTADAHQKTNAQAELDALNYTIKNLENINQNLLNQLQLIQAATAMKPRVDTASSSNEKPQVLPDKSIAQEALHQDIFQRDVMARIEDFNKYLNGKIKDDNHYDFNADLAQRFEAEPTDAEWAENQQLAVSNFFREQKKLADIVPESIVCKSERCRIRIPAASIEEANTIGMTFSEVISTNKNFNNLRALSTIDSDRGVVEIYIPKDPQVQLFK